MGAGAVRFRETQDSWRRRLVDRAPRLAMHLRLGDSCFMANRAATVEAVMTSDPSTLSPSATVGEAHALMKAKGFRHVPVVSEEQLVGILTMTDIGHLGATIPEIRARLVGDVMTRNPITIAPEERVE